MYSDAVADDGNVYFKAAGTDRREAEVVYFGTDTAQKEKGYAYTDDVAVAWYDYKGSFLDGLDALLATVQMPAGIPVATVAPTTAPWSSWTRTS